jgi:XapX domain-containing protein
MAHRLKDYLVSFIVGVGVGLLYAFIRVKSPVRPLVALIGLLGIVIGEQIGGRLLPLVRETVFPSLVTHLHSLFK